jgi:hypothetical protein
VKVTITSELGYCSRTLFSKLLEDLRDEYGQVVGDHVSEDKMTFEISKVYEDELDDGNDSILLIIKHHIKTLSNFKIKTEKL